jgi:hypothetical protein
MNGEAWVRAQFPTTALNHNFWLARTRDNVPDYVPASTADDTFTLMAQRMMPLVRAGVIASGGVINPDGSWTMPDVPTGDLLNHNPTVRAWFRSATHAVRAQSGSAIATVAPVGTPPTNRGISQAWPISNGLETDSSGIEELDTNAKYTSTQGPAQSSATFTTEYSLPVSAVGAVFIEGDHFADATSTGGWWQSATLEVRQADAWVPIAATQLVPADAAKPFQTIRWVFDQPVTCTGVRAIVALPASGFATCTELDLLLPASVNTPLGLDVSADGVITGEDAYQLAQHAGEVNMDGRLDSRDSASLLALARMRERSGLLLR